MSFLFVNTSSRSAEIAFEKSIYRAQGELGGAEALSPLLENIEDLSKIQRIIYISGPGSYTGLRVGYSFCKGLSLGLNLVATGISTFIAHLCLIPNVDGKIGIAIPASPTDYFYAEFQAVDGYWQPLSEASLITKQDLDLLTEKSNNEFRYKLVEEFFSLPSDNKLMFEKLTLFVDAKNIDWKGHVESKDLIYIKPVAAKSIAERKSPEKSAL